jgi:DNA-binding NtrC family response regulator
MPSTVLIVDDEKNIRRTVRMVLEGEGFAVEEAASGEEALARLPDVGADVMLLDVQLPGISGLDTIERVANMKTWKAGDPPPTVIMISGHATLADAVRAVKAGAYDLIEKPLDRERLIVALRNALERRTMAREVAGLRALTGERSEMVGHSAPMAALHAQIAKVAPTRTRVLITGESGTGKELIARALHENSSRHGGPFIKINCAAIPKTLMESELFGYEKGAFTGAVGAKPGRFELAHGGTLFLDEIGEIPIEMQVKLLRVLQESEFERVGGIKTIKVDVRLVTATNRDLLQEIAAGAFREDLFYRLNVVPIHIPPLRDRREDIPLLTDHFIAKFNERLRKQIEGISPDATERLVAHPWPGNIRELENLMERTVLFCEGPQIGVADLPPEIGHLTPVALPTGASAAPSPSPSPSPSDDGARGTGTPAGSSLKEAVRAQTERVERELIQRALDETGGNVTQAARKLKISRKSLQTKMKEFGLRDQTKGE